MNIFISCFLQTEYHEVFTPIFYNVFNSCFNFQEVKYKPSGLIKNGPKTDVAPVINEESVDNKEDIVQDTVKSKNE